MLKPKEWQFWVVTLLLIAVGCVLSLLPARYLGKTFSISIHFLGLTFLIGGILVVASAWIPHIGTGKLKAVVQTELQLPRDWRFWSLAGFLILSGAVFIFLPEYA